MRETSIWQIDLYMSETPSGLKAVVWMEADTLEEVIENLKKIKEEIGDYNKSVKAINRISCNCFKSTTKTITIEV